MTLGKLVNEVDVAVLGSDMDGSVADLRKKKRKNTREKSSNENKINKKYSQTRNINIISIQQLIDLTIFGILAYCICTLSTLASAQTDSLTV